VKLAPQLSAAMIRVGADAAGAPLTDPERMLFHAQVRFEGEPGWVTVKVAASRQEAAAAGAQAYASRDLGGRHPREVRLILAPAQRV
jgi:hypothetical protein